MIVKVYFKARRLDYITSFTIFCASDTAGVRYFWESNLATLHTPRTKSNKAYVQWRHKWVVCTFFTTL